MSWLSVIGLVSVLVLVYICLRSIYVGSKTGDANVYMITEIQFWGSLILLNLIVLNYGG